MASFSSGTAALEERLAFLETATAPVVALAGIYENGHVVAPHKHRRAQFLHARSGVVMVSTAEGRWMVPPENAMWIPAGTVHSVEMLGRVDMHSVYLDDETGRGAPSRLCVLAMSELMRALVALAIACDGEPESGSREALAMELLVSEIRVLQERPLALPLPADERMARLCRDFLDRPAARAAIDDWAGRLGMSRRSFTRSFQRETGVSLQTWRQQACLFAALPRLAAGQSVTTVALDLGYESVPAFTTMFTRMVGTSPRAYRSRAAVRGAASVAAV